MRDFQRSPDVSIVVPCFNAARFLEETLDSVRAQSHRRWELLVVDDGSTDGSAALAARHARRDPGRVRVLRHPGGAHRGAFASRLLGVRRARTGLIALLDADDVWLPDYLRRHLAFWRRREAQGIALSYGPAIYWHPGAPAARSVPHAMPASMPAVFGPGELLQNFLSSGHDTEPRTSCSLLRRDAVLAMARFEPAARAAPLFEDNFLTWGIAARWPVAMHPHAWVRYRQKWKRGARPKSLYRRLCREEAAFLRGIRSHLVRWQPRHPLLGPGGLEARLAELDRPGRRTLFFGGYFFERIPEELRRLAKIRR